MHATTLKSIVEKLSAEIRAYMQQPETMQKMAEHGAAAVVLDFSLARFSLRVFGCARRLAPHL